MYDIETIRVMYSKRAVELTEHFIMRMSERNLKLSDVKNAVMTGDIIEQDLDDYPHPSILIYGHTGDKPLHVAIGVDDDLLWLITAYYPSLKVWETDYKTRKVVE
jgi:hypothetical protein